VYSKSSAMNRFLAHQDIGQKAIGDQYGLVSKSKQTDLPCGLLDPPDTANASGGGAFA